MNYDSGGVRQDQRLTRAVEENTEWSVRDAVVKVGAAPTGWVEGRLSRKYGINRKGQQRKPSQQLGNSQRVLQLLLSKVKEEDEKVSPQYRPCQR